MINCDFVALFVCREHPPSPLTLCEGGDSSLRLTRPLCPSDISPASGGNLSPSPLVSGFRRNDGGDLEIRQLLSFWSSVRMMVVSGRSAMSLPMYLYVMLPFLSMMKTAGAATPSLWRS